MLRSQEQIIDELLVLEAQKGESRALEVLSARWHRRLQRHAARLLGSPERAQDASQEAWLAIVQGLRRLDDPARFGAWAYRIVRNKCADRLRSQQRERLDPLPDELVQEGEADEVGLLRQAIRRLPAERRELMSLFYFDGLGIDEIASITGLAAGTVKSRLFHIRALLRRIIEEAKAHEG